MSIDYCLIFIATPTSVLLTSGVHLITSGVPNMNNRNVHLRYENSKPLPGDVFAFRVRVDSITAQTCDEDGSIPDPDTSVSSGHTFLLEFLNRKMFRLQN
ncbi:hypothetical protein OUZ56_024705 [Daphnia magna]|uniref:Uncharacterized protein n=1 Tax=Daphnia magna TaxID=35525 RepID=A0ABQ9ZHQ8_9CRUS|nr:hypothetical protein OUZ56_024705 [Daphnia magna]